MLRSTKYQDDMKNKILGTTTATDQANIVMIGYRETLNRATEWIKDLGISFFSVGKYIAPFVTGIAGAVIVLANLSNASTGIKMLFSLLKTMPSISMIVSGSFAGMSTAVRAFSVAIMNIPVIGWILAVIAALIALGVYFYKTSAAFRGFVWGMWEAAKTVFTGLFSFINAVGNGILHILQGVFNPANWFNKNYKWTDGLKQISDAATAYGKQIGESFQKGKAAGMGDFAKEKAEKDKAGATTTSTAKAGGKAGDLDINGVAPTISPKTLGSGKGKSEGGSKGEGSTKIQTITQKIDMKNYFTVSTGGSSNIDEVAERVIRALNDKLRDGMVAVAN